MRASPNTGRITRAVKRAWIPLVLVVVLAVSTLGVSRLHKIFGSQDLNAGAGAGIEIVQFNPKVVVYEVAGAPGTTANINYWDENANTHQVNEAPLPWSFTISTTLPAVRVVDAPVTTLAGLAAKVPMVGVPAPLVAMV